MNDEWTFTMRSVIPHVTPPCSHPCSPLSRHKFVTIRIINLLFSMCCIQSRHSVWGLNLGTLFRHSISELSFSALSLGTDFGHQLQKLKVEDGPKWRHETSARKSVRQI